jgi:hypothetical protein
MRRFTVLCCSFALIGCAKEQTPAADSVAAAPPPPPALSLADVAGKWNVTGRNEAGDTVLVSYELTATADTAGWSIKFDNGQTVPLVVMGVGGDSVVIHAGPYPSVLRKGVQVTTQSIMRLTDGKLQGTATAHYNVKTADSVRTLRTEGVRAP